MKKAFLFCCIGFLPLLLWAQQEGADSVSGRKKSRTPEVYIPKDSVAIADSIRRARTRKTTRHSAIIPGWGQINNRQIWKVPVVYGGIGFTVYLFFDNIKSYRELRNAYIIRLDNDPTNDNDIPERYKPLSNNSIRFYRDEFRRNVDYSVLAFIAAWGLNVVDAAVFANLRDFDVSDQISLRLKAPSLQPLTGQTFAGVSLQFKKPEKVLKPLPGR